MQHGMDTYTYVYIPVHVNFQHNIHLFHHKPQVEL